MILEIQKKIWKNGIDLTEKTLETLYKDKAFLQFSSIGLNMGLWWQKSCNRTAGWLFKGLNVPTEDQVKSLLENLHSLESRNNEQEDRIKELEAELEFLKKSKEEKVVKARTPRTRKTPVPKTARKKSSRAEQAYSH
jgi:vacuolar-type H+-ATPase subunit I/STV1